MTGNELKAEYSWKAGTDKFMYFSIVDHYARST